MERGLRVAVAGVVLALAAAAGCDLPDPGPRPTPTPSTTSSTAPPTTAPPEGWPTPDTTGVPAGTVLVDDPRCTLAIDREVIEGRRLTCPTRIAVTAPMLTIRESLVVTGLNNWHPSGGRSMVVEDTTVGSLDRCTAAGDFALGAQGMTLRRVEVYGQDGLRISQVGPGIVLVEDSYIAACSVAGSHSDGIQADGTTGGHTIRHNTIDMTAASSMTAAVFWGDSAAGPATVVDNLFVGYRNWGTFLASTGGASHVVDGNRFAAGAGGVTNRADQCGHIDWRADNRAVTVDRYRVAQVGDVVTCG